MNSLLHLASSYLQNPGAPGVLLDAAVKSMLALALAAGICLLGRGLSAAMRHLVWLLALVGALLLPLFSFSFPSWHRPLWTVSTGLISGNQYSLVLELTPSPLGAPANASATPAQNESRHAQVRMPGGRVVTQFSVLWARAALGAWLIGVALFLCSSVLAQLRLRAIRRQAQALRDSDWIRLLEESCANLRIRRGVRLWISSREVMPLTWGCWWPSVLLPAEARQWSAERRRIVLCHELAHVKRWDCLSQAMSRIACVIYWFNPLVWIAARQMRLEREQACDDLVLNGGCRASDYASHLVQIARSFRPVSQLPTIAMARSSRLRRRIDAIIDASRNRQTPSLWVLGFLTIGLLGLVAAMAAQKPQPPPAATSADSGAKPWFDERLRAFFAAKANQAHQLNEQEPKPLAPEVWPYFEAGMKGDWTTATNLWWAMRERAGQYDNLKMKSDERICATPVWSTILETDLAWEQFANWQKKYVLAYGNDIIKSIPPGSIYFGGTDPGRGVITAMSESHAEGKPFFTITQNAFADGMYLDYLRAMYGSKLYMPTADDSKRCFNEYLADAEQRLKAHKLRPGEDVKEVGGKVQVSGQIAVMAINGQLSKLIFDKNPDRACYIEESFPLDWMYPHLSPNGLIMKINRQPLSELSPEIVGQDHEYWARYVAPMIGDWLTEEIPLKEVTDFIERAYWKQDLRGFKGDPLYLQDGWAQAAFSKLRSSIGGLYAWRANHASNDAEKDRMAREAEFAFRQALVLCPRSPEAVFRYVSLLMNRNRLADALLIARTADHPTPPSVQLPSGTPRDNPQIDGLIKNLEQMNARQSTR